MLSAIDITPTITQTLGENLRELEFGTLRDAAEKKGFLIGSAFQTKIYNNDSIYADTFKKEFNIGTAENHCKMGATQREKGDWDLTDCLAHVQTTIDNGQKFRGHTLVWHQGLPRWLEEGEFSEEELDIIMKDHIFAVMGGVKAATKGHGVYAWDVVNEAVTWVKGEGWRIRDYWPADHVHRAFTWAHQADPETLLFYNDFGLEDRPFRGNSKADAVRDMIAGMQAEGVPIHGVGLQYHVSIDDEITRESTAQLIKSFGDMGLQVHITEMDVTLCSAGPCEATNEALQKQAQMYEDALAACFYDNPEVCTAFVSWGFTDKYTWKTYKLNGQVHPLYYDELFTQKPAYFRMLDALTAPIDTFAFDDISFGTQCGGSWDGECQSCDGDTGTCRWSYPLGDPARGASRQATCRCERKIDYGGSCENNNDGFCGDSCSDCRFSWPLTDPKRWKSAQADCRCEPRGKQYQWGGKCENNHWCYPSGCDDCYWAWPANDPISWNSDFAKCHCKSVIEKPDPYVWKGYCWNETKRNNFAQDCDGCEECRWSWPYEDRDLAWKSPNRRCRCKP